MFKCTACQTQRPMVMMHVVRMFVVPRDFGSGCQVRGVVPFVFPKSVDMLVCGP